MAFKSISPQMGRAALGALISERSPLGPLKVMAKQMGRFFQIPIPGFRPIVVFGPEANRKVLVTERDKVMWRNLDPVTDLLRHGVLVTDGEEHERYRKLMEPALHPSQLPEYTQMMIEQTERVSSMWKDGETVDMLVESRKIALLIIMQALFSKDVWGDLQRIWTPILKTIEYISPGLWIFWRRMPRLGFRKHIKLLDDYLYKIISDRRRLTMDHQPNDGLASTLSSGAPPLAPAPRAGVPRVWSATMPGSLAVVHRPNDLLQRLLDAGLSDDLIRDQMLTMLIAGHDTSTALLAWTFALLGGHPEVYKQLTREMEVLEKSPLLDQVIKESLRLYPPIHIGNRILGEEIDFGGDKAHASERIFYSIYLTHRDPSIWEDAEDFCPERFARGRKTPPFSYVPFGGGPRTCIGAAFGQAEARIVLTHLLKTFTFEFTNHEIRPHMGATLEPRPGVRMKVTRRKRVSRRLATVGLEAT